ncbi:S9 family peptidase [Novosphingobium olei]|uniref:S9 family peptidase n=1 Tax=Novosphingobium olei TaxID=2728851 RepID=A0A7Y0BP03_9SPHN|nr:alpha/beta fold hydrolase [Novosphingobium olei]NML93972.1 S9 family peptidase [Novosphingobium olei]
MRGTPESLIPRASLFGYPARFGLQISPCGRWFGWIAPIDGVANIWVAPFAAIADARPVTRDTGRGITGFSFARDGRTVLYGQDSHGDENWHVFAADISTGESRDLTPWPGAQCSIAGLSRKRPGEVLVSANARDPRYADLHLIDLASGATTLVIENPGFAHFLTDEQFVPRFAVAMQPDGGSAVLARSGEAWEPLMVFPEEDARTSGPSGLDAAGETLFYYDSRGRDTAALYALDLASKTPRLIASDDRADISGTIADLETWHPLAFTVTYALTERHVLDEVIRPTIDLLDRAGLGNWTITSRTDDDRYWTIGASSDLLAGSSWLLDRQEMTVRQLYEVRPELTGKALAPMAPVVIPSRDGLNLVSYLTLPAGAGSLEQGVAAPLPAVLLVHGGPWDRDGFGYNPEAQWLANRGYAVLQVNFRSSTGLGKAFMRAGANEWGARMDDDLEDALEWAIGRGFIDPARMAIMGASYGGYAVLSALTQRPERFVCGIDIVGPANLQTLIDEIPPYWEDARLHLYANIGDPRTEAGRAQLIARSPIHHAAKIRRPLLIAQGANDPRVLKQEADQMAAAMQANGIPGNYLLFPDEGHGFARPANDIAFKTVAEAFLAHHLGGASQPPVREEVAGTTMQVVEGEAWLRDLHRAITGLA